MATPAAVPVYADAASLAQFPGPQTRSRYAIVDGIGLFRWYPSDTTAADNLTVIAPSGGAAGRWKLSSAFPGASTPPRVDVVATSNLDLSGLETIDGESLTAGMTVLPTAQSDATQNVPMVVAAGAWTRPTWFDADSDALPGMLVSVLRGTANGGSLWRMSSPTSGSVDIGTTEVAWAKVTAPLSDANPANVGATAAGVAATAARSDHVHSLGAQTSITVADSDASMVMSRTAANQASVAAAAGDTLRLSSDTALRLDSTTINVNLDGAYAQLVCPRHVFNVSGWGNVLDLKHTSLESHLGLERQIRVSGSGAPYLGLHDRLPVELQSAHDLPTLLAALTRQGVIHNDSLGYTVYIRGDSLWSTSATVPTARASRVLEGLLSPAASVETCSLPGDYSTSPAHSFINVPNSGKNVCVITWGINNFLAGQSAATVQANITAEVAAAVAAGFDAIVVVAPVKAGTAVHGAAQETERGAYTTWLAANFGSIGATHYIDASAFANLTDPTNATYFQADQLHFTDAGHTAYATGFDAPISAILTGQALSNSTIAGNDVAITATDDVSITAGDQIGLTASGAHTLTAGSTVLTVSASFFAQLITSLWIVAADQHYLRAATSVQHSVRYVPADTVTSDATATNAWTLSTTSNRVYHVTVRAVGSNDTDNEGIVFEPRRAAFRNVAGTLTQIGSTVPAAPEDLADAIGTAALTLDASGTSIRARVTGIAAKSIRWRLIVDVDEVTLA